MSVMFEFILFFSSIGAIFGRALDPVLVQGILLLIELQIHVLFLYYKNMEIGVRKLIYN